jgi:hypothetical protein
MIRDNSNKPASVRLEKRRMMDQWYIRRKAKWITYAYSLYQHMAVIRVNPLHNTGHEIYGLFVKSGSEENPGIQGAVAG